MLDGELRRHQTRTPRQRHARAAMTVVVNQEPIVQLVGLEDESGIAMRPQPHRRADNAVPGRVDRGQRDALPGTLPRFAPYRAAAKSDTDRRHPRRRQEGPSVHGFTCTGQANLIRTEAGPLVRNEDEIRRAGRGYQNSAGAERDSAARLITA